MLKHHCHTSHKLVCTKGIEAYAQADMHPSHRQTCTEAGEVKLAEVQALLDLTLQLSQISAVNNVRHHGRYL